MNIQIPWVAALAVMMVLPTVFPTRAAPTEKPETFVHRVYARYRANGPNVLTTRPEGTPYYAATLLDEFAKDEALAHGEVRAIDSDPLCSCQDHGTVEVKAIAISAGSVDTVKARVTLRNFGVNSTIVLTLLQTPAGWRIADVSDQDTKSLLAYLRDSNAQPTQDPSPAKP